MTIRRVEATSSRLVDRARRGQPEALAELLTRGRRRLERITREQLGRRLRARMRTSDVVQSAYLEILRGLEHFEGKTEKSFEAWAAHVLRNKLRKKGRYFGSQKRCEPDEGAGPISSIVDERTRTPSRQVAAAEHLAAARAALGDLPADDREIVERRVFLGQDFERIARDLGVTVTNARTRLFRVRQALKVALRHPLRTESSPSRGRTCRSSP